MRLHTTRFPWAEVVLLVVAMSSALGFWAFPRTLSLAPTLVAPTWHLAVVWALWRLMALEILLARRQPWVQGGLWAVRVDQLARELPRDKAGLFFGRAFRWTMQHTQTLESVLARDGALPLDRRGPRGGTPALGAVGAKDEEALVLDHATLTRHVLLTGTPGSGKSVLLALLARRAITEPGCVAVFDPKGDADLFMHCQDAARRVGKPFVCLTPAFLAHSIHMNVLSTASTPDEVASRIRALMPSAGGRNPNPFFEEYCLTMLTQIAAAQQALGEPWTLEGLYGAATIRERTKALLHRYLAALGIPIPPKDNINEQIKAYGQAKLGDLLADDLIKLWQHDQDHYRSITATLDPTFRGLIGHPYGPLFSPGPEALTWEQLAEGQMVLYVALPALLLNDTANRMGRALLQDLLGYLGRLYVYGDAAKALPMTLIVDELKRLVYPQMTTALAMSRGAQCRWILAQQSMADMEAVLGPAEARVMLDSCTTRIYFALADTKTAQDASQALDECLVRQSTTAHGVGYGGPGGLTGDTRQQTQLTRQATIRPAWFSTLPRGEYFARIDGVAWKGRVPLLTLPPVPLLGTRTRLEVDTTARARRLLPQEILNAMDATDARAAEPAGAHAVPGDGEKDRPGSSRGSGEGENHL
jgi:conjugal transfer pilus assembly protein TraD